MIKNVEKDVIIFHKISHSTGITNNYLTFLDTNEGSVFTNLFVSIFSDASQHINVNIRIVLLPKECWISPKQIDVSQLLTIPKRNFEQLAPHNSLLGSFALQSLLNNGRSLRHWISANHSPPLTRFTLAGKMDQWEEAC